MATVNCLWCHEPFEAPTKRARYCSPSHRACYNRAQKAPPRPVQKPEPAQTRLTTEKKNEAVRWAYAGTPHPTLAKILGVGLSTLTGGLADDPEWKGRMDTAYARSRAGVLLEMREGRAKPSQIAWLMKTVPLDELPDYLDADAKLRADQDGDAGGQTVVEVTVRRGDSASVEARLQRELASMDRVDTEAEE